MSNINDFEIQGERLVRYNNFDDEVVIIPDGVQIIAEETFNYHNEIKSILIPESVVKIEKSAFSRVRNLEKVDFSVSDLMSFLNINFEGNVFSWGGSNVSLYIGGDQVTDIYIPEGITHIDNNQFEGWKGIKSVTIPDSVISIGDEAFNNCKDLEDVFFTDLRHFLSISFGNDVWFSVNLYFGNDDAKNIIIPDDVTSIEGHIFSGLKNIESITIPESLVIEGNFSFNGCSSLGKIIIPKGMTTIGKYAFSGCSSLKNVTIPDSVISIEDNAFSQCKSLDEIEIPNSVTSLGKSAFMDSNLVSIILPDGLNTISWGLFMRCSNLKSVVIPDGVKKIEENAFSNCRSLESIAIPSSVKSIGRNAFEGCDRLAEINAISVSTVADNACQANTVVVLKKYIKDIEKNRPSQRLVFCKTPIQDIKSIDAKRLAVNGFLSVKDLSVYDGNVIESYKKFLKGKVVNYRDFILENDTEIIIRRLASLGLIDSKFVDKMLEQDLSDDIKTLLSESVKTTGKKSSSKESSGKKAPSVTELKKSWSFKKNEEGVTITSYKDVDTKVIVPEMIGKDIVTVIDNWAFSPYKSGLNEAQKQARNHIEVVNLPNTITSIKYGAFNRCSCLKKVAIPYGVTSIDGALFEKCKQLKEVLIPNSVTLIGAAAFSECNSLESIIIPDSVTVLDSSAFMGCERLTEIQLSNNLKEIKYDAFKKCTSLTDITIPDSVTKVYGGVFAECNSLRSVVLPQGLKKVEFYMFDKCASLTDVTILGAETSIDETAFNRCTNFTIHAPAGSFAEKYAKAKKIPFESLE